jgi:2-amino-4-hydroxy-6-hydroxymethyldihydropteridine diphosphokinase
MPRVYLSLGSNLGDRLALLRAAVRALRASADVQVVDTSRLYESEPWEDEPGRAAGERRWYLNCVVAVETTLEPRALLARVHAIEDALGRRRPVSLMPEAQRFAARPIDIDILFYDDLVISAPDDLHVPHLLVAERGFVLRPLADVAPDLQHPTLYRTVRELLAGLADEHTVRAGDHPARWFEDRAG